PNKEEPKEEEKEENAEVVNEDFYEGLMKSSVEKCDEAAEIFLGLNEEELNSLDEDEQVSVYITYLKSGNYDEALEIYPDGAEAEEHTSELQSRFDHVCLLLLEIK